MKQDLNALLFAHRDPSDHVDGGACIQAARGETRHERLERYSEEYEAAISALYVATQGAPSGWAFAAPAVFLAHHACELMLKIRWLRSDPALEIDGQQIQVHDLRKIVRKIAAAGGWSDVTVEGQECLRGHLADLRCITRDGITIRYGNIDPMWCCLNLGALIEMVAAVRGIVVSPPASGAGAG